MYKICKITSVLLLTFLLCNNLYAQKADEVLFEIRDQFDVPVFTVTADGVRFYVKEYTGKGISGGFAVGQYNAAKGTPDTTFFFVSGDSTRVYTKAPKDKAIAGGFAVGQYNSAKSDHVKYLHLTPENIFIGANNGIENTSGTGNIFIGNYAGVNETGSNKLYISNAALDRDNALIFGDFSDGNELVNLNGNLRFNKGGNTITMPASRGTADQVLTINPVDGTTSWQTAADLVSLPKSMQSKLIIFEEDIDFYLVDSDGIRTLVVKTENSKSNQKIFLPEAKSNHGRIITIKNMKTEGIIQIYPNSDTKDIIYNTKKLAIDKGISYSLQAEFDKKRKKGTWYINAVYPSNIP